MNSTVRVILLVLLMAGFLVVGIPVRQAVQRTRQRTTLDDLRVGGTVLVTYKSTGQDASDPPRRAGMRALQITEVIVDEVIPTRNQVRGVLKSVDPARSFIVVTARKRKSPPVDYTFTVDGGTGIAIGSEPELAELSDLGAATILLMGGFRGLAVNVLWLRSIALHEQRRYHEERAILDIISNLQPRYASVWVFQAWNIAYNISVQYETDREQFKWVQEGKDFLLKGQEMLPESADITFYLGVMYSNKYSQSPAFIEFLEQEEGKNNFEEGAMWFARARTLINQGKPLSVFHPRVADSGVFHCCESRYLQILERADISPDGFGRKTLEQAGPWRERALSEAEGLTQRWPRDPAFPTFKTRIDAIPIDAYIFHARKAMFAGNLTEQAETDARVYLGMAQRELNRLASIYTERDDREVLARRVEKIITCLPLIYLFRAQDVVSGWTEMPTGSGKEVVRWIERARTLLESTPMDDDKRRELKKRTDKLLEKVNAMVRAGSSDETEGH